jgi:hypothetical protein
MLAKIAPIPQLVAAKQNAPARPHFQRFLPMIFARSAKEKKNTIARSAWIMSHLLPRFQQLQGNLTR